MKSSLKHYGFCKIFLMIVAAVMFCGCFFSCSKNITVSSLTGTLDEVDRYIIQGQSEAALKLLVKTDKKSLPPVARLGIYRRYVKLGETARAEKLIKSCLKKNPNDKQLLAVYSSILLKKKNIKEALSVSKKLSGTEYGSLYAEALLRSRLENADAVYSFDDFCSDDYVQVYFDAYSGSKDNRWLRNCAVINLVKGKTEQAFAVYPKTFQDSTDAYFWSLVTYDNKKFVDAAENLKTAMTLLDRELADEYDLKRNIHIKRNLNLKIRALLADSYINLSEEKLAEKERNSLLEYITTLEDEALNSGDISISGGISSDDVLSIIYLNSAVWALSRDDLKGAYNLLSFCVQHWPDFVPGLIAYGNYAYNSNQLKLDDPMTQELRKLGIRSMDMEAYDELPKIPVEDAIARMEDSLGRFKNFELYVAKLDLEDKIQNYSDKAYYGKIYNTIERNTLGTNLYPPEIARYAVHGLLMLDRKEEAESLFNLYISSRYQFDDQKNFYDELFIHIHEIQKWEVEYAAWFAAEAGKAKLACQLYEFVVFNEYIKDSKKVREISPRASIPAMMNLSMIYSSTKQKSEALALYGKTASLSQNLREKSEALYRVGILYNEMDKVEDAIKSLKYSIYLNPDHSRARLLLAKLKG